MRLVHSARELRRPSAGHRVVVMTMGALHEGHAELIRRARSLAGRDGEVVVTVFVNPSQFGPGEDFDRYPRTLEADTIVCEQAGADIVFAPDVVEMYGNEAGFHPGSITVDPGPLGDVLEGAIRPGHFRGVLTVVNKLLALTQPDIALFGEKDYQQLVLIRSMARDLSIPVEIIGVPTVREPDGLALSSRNRYLSESERASAALVPIAVRAVVDNLHSGIDAAVAAGRTVLAQDPTIVVDYLTVTDLELGPAPKTGEARVLIAVRLGSTRLLDNLGCRLDP